MKRVAFLTHCLIVIASLANALDGIGVAKYMGGGETTLRLWHLKNSSVVAQRDLCKENFFGTPAINTHATHVAFWQTISNGKAQTDSTTKWQDIFPKQQFAIDYLLGVHVLNDRTASMTLDQIAAIIGCSENFVQERKSALEKIKELYRVPASDWANDELRESLGSNWNIKFLYDSNTKMWKYGRTLEKPRYALVIMSLDPSNTKKETLLYCGEDITIETPYPGFHGGVGNLEWPQGDWIYFSTTKEVKFLYRVNVQTKKVELVTRFNCFFGGENRELKLSADGATMLVNRLGKVFKLSSVQPNGLIPLTNWTDGGTGLLGGCGHTMAPSGNRVGFQTDAGHTIYNILDLDWQTRKNVVTFKSTKEDRNAWSVNKNDPQLACEISTGFIESVGIGQETEGMSFAVNSDDWVCLISGWAPRGRFGSNGMNFILVNHEKHIAINVSKHLRNNDSRFAVNSACVTAEQRLWVDDVEFVLTGPQEEILPSLRGDLGVVYKVPGIDLETAAQPTEMARTPYTGVVAAFTQNSSAIYSKQSSLQVGKTAIGFKHADGIVYSAYPMSAVSFYELSGRLMFTLKTDNAHSVTLPQHYRTATKGYRLMTVRLRDGSVHTMGVVIK